MILELNIYHFKEILFLILEEQVEMLLLNMFKLNGLLLLMMMMLFQLIILQNLTMKFKIIQIYLLLFLECLVKLVVVQLYHLNHFLHLFLVMLVIFIITIYYYLLILLFIIILIILLGISYALKRSLVKPFGQHEFYNGPREDYRLLNELHLCNHDILISQSITYYVRGYTLPNPPTFQTSIIKGIDSCDPDSYVEKYPAVYDFTFPENFYKFETYRHGIQGALLRAASTSCVDSVLFQNWIHVEFHFAASTTPQDVKKTFIQVLYTKIYIITYTYYYYLNTLIITISYNYNYFKIINYLKIIFVN